MYWYCKKILKFCDNISNILKFSLKSLNLYNLEINWRFYVFKNILVILKYQYNIIYMCIDFFLIKVSKKKCFNKVALGMLKGI